MQSSLIILTFNEIEGVKALFKDIPFNQFDECFVIDGGSKDGTKEFFEERNIKVISQEKKGRGEAFRIGMEISNSDAIVFFSPDGNEDINDIVKLADAIKQGNDMAIASRFLPESQTDEAGSFIPYRSWANQIFTSLANLCFKGNLTDAINGFRAVNKNKFKELKINADGFAVEYQMSIRAMKKKQRVKEILTIERKRIGGESTAKSIPTGFKILKVLLKEILIGKNF